MESNQPQQQLPASTGIVETTRVILKRAVITITVMALFLFLILGAGDRWVRRLTNPGRPVVHEVRALTTALYAQLDKDVLTTLEGAEAAALQHAEQELVAYFEELQGRADGDFCEWYFSYLNQQMLIANYLVTRITRGHDAAREHLTTRIESEFANRVFSAQTAGLRFQRIVDDSIMIYAEQVHAGLQVISLKYRIPAEPWAEYLSSLGGIVANINPVRSVSVGAKAAVLAGTAATIIGGRVLAELITTMVKRLTGRIAAETVEISASRGAAVVGIEIAGRFLGPILAVGLIAWEWYDHTKTVTDQTPLLVSAVHEFFNELKKKLLADIKGVLAELKETVARNMTQKR